MPLERRNDHATGVYITLPDIRDLAHRLTGTDELVDKDVLFTALRFTLPSERGLDLLERAAQFFTQFVSDPPFVIDNGLVGRRALSLFLRINGYIVDPNAKAWIELTDAVERRQAAAVDVLALLRGTAVSRSPSSSPR